MTALLLARYVFLFALLAVVAASLWIGTRGRSR